MVQIGGAAVACLTPAALPWRNDRYVGKQPVTARLGAFVGRDSGEQLVTVVGPAGVGKSRLALEVCSRVLRSGGVHYVPLADAGTRNDLLGAVAGALGVPLGEGGEAQLLNALQAREPTLLWLDDCDLVAGCAGDLIEAWLAAAPGLTILATARRALRLRGERELSISPLDEEDGVELFVARSPTRHDDLPSVRAVVQRLDGLPLAIELAAARTSVLSPSQLLQRLSERARLLSRTSGARRHRSMAAALDVSWSLLDVHEREALARCAVFVGGFDLEAAEVVLESDAIGAPWAIDVLESLVRHHLVVVDGDRYRLLESVAEYARAHLHRDTDAQHAVARCHAQLYFDRYARGEPGPAHTAWLHIADDVLNIEAAIERSSSAGDIATATPLALALAEYRAWFGPLNSGITVLESLATARGEEQIAARLSLGRLRHLAGDPTGIDDLVWALDAARARRDATLEGTALLWLANAQASLPYDERTTTYRRALACVEAGGDPLKIASAQIWLGDHLQTGDEARALVEAGLRVARWHQHLQLEAHARYVLGQMAFVSGRRAAALEYFEEALSRSRAVGIPRYEFRCLLSLSCMQADEAPSEAIAHGASALRVARHLGDLRLEISARAILADAHTDSNPERALDEWTQLVELAERAEDPRQRAAAAICRGEALMRLQRTSEAREVLEEVIAATEGPELGHLASKAAICMCLLPDAGVREISLLDRLEPLAARNAERHVQLLTHRALLREATGDEAAARADLAIAEERLGEIDRLFNETTGEYLNTLRSKLERSREGDTPVRE